MNFQEVCYSVFLTDTKHPEGGTVKHGCSAVPSNSPSHRQHFTIKLSFAAATTCHVDQNKQFDSGVMFLSHYLYFSFLQLKNTWKTNLFLLDRTLLLLYGVKVWLHSDADKQDDRKAVFSNMFLKKTQPRHLLKTLKPFSQWEFQHLLLSERTKGSTHSKKIPVRQTNRNNLSTLRISSDFCLS